MSGFKLIAPPPPPPVLAGEGETTCGQSPAERGRGVYCERPVFHDGGHLSRSHDRYWQADESRREPAMSGSAS